MSFIEFVCEEVLTASQSLLDGGNLQLNPFISTTLLGHNLGKHI